MSEPALIPIQQQSILFYDDEITAVQVERGGKTAVMVPLRPLCDYLGVDWSAQLQRLRRDPVLSEMLSGVVITPTPLSQSKFSNPQEMVCLPLQYLNGWLFGINANRVKKELRDRLITYQREVYEILAAAFITTELEAATSAEQQSLVQIREMALAIAGLADQQIALTTRLDKAAVIVGEHGRRITALEQQLAPRQAITDEQAADIAAKVKDLAGLMAQHNPSKNHFGEVFAELYRRFRTSSYKTIRQNQYHLVMAFLDDWQQAITSPQE